MSDSTITSSYEAELCKAFSHFPSGLAAIAANIDGSDHVILVASFSVGISLNPPLVSFAVQRISSTWPILRQAPRLGVSVLSSGQHALCRQLSSKDKETRWQGVHTEKSEAGAILLPNAALTLECSIYSTLPAGDHEMILLEVNSFKATPDLDPLIFHGSRFRTLEITS